MPEPSSILSLLVMGTMGAGFWLKRRQSSDSDES
ncbi:PEP-CTERM sorting domain-containing protein [Oscillatoria sp. FACHB-1407]|nr:PEP-CTERM sorting domain-containing protein [Oscillatoria sp. FACHB-1407]